MGQGVAAATRVAGEMGRIGWGTAAARLGRRDPMAGAPPRRAEDLTAAWLSLALSASFPGVRVRTVTVLHDHVGTTTHVRVGLDYEGSPPAGAPDALFAKLASQAPGIRVFGNVMGLGRREVAFYRSLAPELTVRLPPTFHARHDDRDGTFVILQTDLQGPGLRFATMDDDCTLDDARAVMAGLAELHAAFWDSPRLQGDLAWLPAPETDPEGDLGRLVTRLSTRRYLERYAELIPASIRDEAPIIDEHRERLDTIMGEGPRTVLHGDCHIGNLYFTDEGVGFLDWQVVRQGPGMRDVTYFMVSSLPVELRRTHERALIGLYLGELERRGLTPPTFEEAWAQHRLMVVNPWIAALVTGALGTMQHDEVIRRATVRAVAALDDLDTFAAVRSAVA